MTNTQMGPQLSANEAACITGVPVERVRRIIDQDLPGIVAHRPNGSRTVHRDGLVGLKIAQETRDILTLEGRRRVLRHLVENPDARTVRDRHVSVDIRSMKREVRKGLSLLAKARAAISRDRAVLSGAPCIRGTRVPAHLIAEMFANGDSVEALLEAYPYLTETQIEAAILYSHAYPRRRRPHPRPFWRGLKPIASSEITIDELRAIR